MRCLPTASIGDDAWAIVEALLALLPRVAAQLTVTFAERGRIDFVEGALAALRALGRADTPSDLLLRLDGAIHHLLIDEFQDTSVTQHAMIERLVAGWTPGDGRTLFAVGDPMQSIYRFRAAEVRLFVEAQERGRIGDVAVESLTLRRNFRAQANLVEWVNGAFPAVLGARNDPLRSIVAFADASAAKPAREGIDVTFDALPDVGSEARTVVAHVQRALDEGDASVAILVRTRRHAEPLLPALRDARIAFTAVELDSFAERPAIRDLTALTHALVQPADRLAWHALLRAPWCGLRLADLVAIAASDATRERTLVAALTAPNEIAALSDDGRARLARIAEALVPALASRGQASVAARVRGAWLAMGGPACIEDASDLEAAERYFALLAQAETAGDLTNWAAFAGTLARLREGDAPPDVRVRLMTLHRAKGLEFDTVVMPALARVGQKASTELLRWRRRHEGLLIAPGTPRGGDVDPIYAYLGRLAADEESAELGRLLYVGCTRAKRRLHLTAAWRPRRDPDTPSGWRWSAPASGSALAKLWPIMRETLREPPIDVADTSTRASSVLLRVPPAWRTRVPDDMLDSPREVEAVEEAPAFDWVRETARHVGVVVHRVLAQIARDGLGSWPDTRIDALAPALALALSSEGVDAPELADAVFHATQALASVLADPRGRWLFDPSHAEARSEWALAGVDAGALVHRTLDRTFVDRGVRWIVDFKTGRHEGGDVDAFLDAERDRYAPSLETYARLVRALDPRPIRLALYHPLVRGWREWDFDG
jgi:ATP-dependent exoDNAse (exonuclease V) beta subunit